MSDIPLSKKYLISEETMQIIETAIDSGSIDYVIKSFFRNVRRNPAIPRDDPEHIDEDLLESLKIDKDGIEIISKGGASHRFIIALANFYLANGGENYFTMTFEGTVREERKRYEITIRDLKGNKSPAETIRELKADIALLRGEPP